MEGEFRTYSMRVHTYEWYRRLGLAFVLRKRIFIDACTNRNNYYSAKPNETSEERAKFFKDYKRTLEVIKEWDELVRFNQWLGERDAMEDLLEEAE